MAILSRSFCNVNNIGDINQITALFRTGVTKIRDYEIYLGDQSNQFFEDNIESVRHKVMSIAESIA